MPFLKFSLLGILTLSGPSKAWASTTHECLHADFSTKISHPGRPFGLHEVSLFIEKNQCEAKIRHQKLGFIKRSWHFDVCRRPVHLKVGNKVVDVYKRSGPCLNSQSRAPYCRKVRELYNLIEDDGLVFAEGHGEDPTSEHGQVRCIVQLFEEYLEKGRALKLGPAAGPPSSPSPPQSPPTDE